ncbi:uncharacterized protein SCODWIG_02364 [Saccharomycodes ludwigii]|uniref:C2 domain-containing protein n=1 Tax=Saccharomycodes ludwigii TaxID=36035 RepID=A0A376B7F1_9ASCO|nr:uncharacterized protein SCODWIG_02364 [Saccharomycodes ludwigii]
MSSFDNTFVGVYGTLIAFVHRGKDLNNVRKLDKQSPFIILRIAHMTARSKVCFRGGQTPTWNFLAEFEITPDVKPLMTLEVYHETEDAPKPIGKTTLDFTTAIFSDEKDGDDRWVEIYNGSEFAGKIYLELSFKPKDPEEMNGKAGKNILDEIDKFEQSVASRELPPLPTDDECASMSNPRLKPYVHGSRYVEPHSPKPPIDLVRDKTSPKYLDNGRLVSVTPSKNTSPFTYSDDEDDAEHEDGKEYNGNVRFSPDQFKNTSSTNGSSTNTTVTTSEPLFAKLKEIKDKMFSFKNPNSDAESSMSRSAVSSGKVNFEELEKAVGVARARDDTNSSVYRPYHVDDSDDEDERFNIINRARSRASSTSSINHDRKFTERSMADAYSASVSPSRRSGYYGISPTRDISERSSIKPPEIKQLKLSPNRKVTAEVNAYRRLQSESPTRNNTNSPRRRPPPPQFR